MYSDRKSSFLSSWIIFIVCTTTNVSAHFYGGSLSYKLELVNGKPYAHVELLTAWAIKQGPCGATCTKANIASPTRSTRLQMKQSHGNDYFGTFTTDLNSVPRNISSIVQSNYTETVYAVDAAGQWEQDFMKFSFDVLNNDVDLNFDGKSWRGILLNDGTVSSTTAWHLQTKIRTDTRSDTNGLNSVPRVIITPIYRIKLGIYSKIDVTAIDPDGDYVKCLHAQFNEAGKAVKKSKGVELKDCAVYVNATTALGYNGDSWIVVAVMLTDYNKKRITFGSTEYLPISNSLGASTVQFLVHILAEVNSPTFIDPTLKNGHAFIVYAGSSWKTSVYAQAADKSTIVEFRTVNLDRENFVVSSIKDGSKQGEKYVEITWDTTAADIGHHLLCISAIDNNGVDSDLLCFKLEVRENVFTYTTHGESYFMNVPAPGEGVNCEAEVTCLLPIFVRSPSEVQAITVGESYTEESSLSGVQTVTYKGETTYKATLSFSDPSTNFENMCFNALSDKQETLASTCIHTAIQSKDPCESSPCHSPAECISDRQTGSFICNCSEFFSGKFCEKAINPCDLHPCINGACYFQSHKLFCLCTGSGFTGTYCETNINDCHPNSCNNSGICKDRVNRFECDCHGRYDGSEPKNCSADKCSGDKQENLICDNDLCPVDVCNGHGVCRNTDECTCLYGYTKDINCSASIGNLHVTGVEFLESSPKDGELQTCFVNGAIVDCQIPVYLVTESGSSAPSVTVQTKPELRSLVTLGSIQTTANFQGITNVYSSTATIKGTLSDKKDQYICFTADIGTSQTSLCLQLEFVSDPLLDQDSIASVQKNAAVKFVSPTLNDGSKLTCNSTETCRLVMFTEAQGSVCQDVLSPTKGVTVFPTQLQSGVCVTEVSYKLSDSQANKTDICFQTLKTNFQQRCYEVEVPNPACKSSPCQNGGHCFRNRKKDAVEAYQCICNPGYTGDRCEKGPCPSNDCLNDAYCIVNDGVETCLCKAGFYGSKCELLLNPHPIYETSFTSTARPSTFQCVQYQTCSFTIIAEGTVTETRPNIIPGYVSPYIHLDEISVVPMKDAGGYLVNVMFETAKEGVQYVCIQTVGGSGQNVDEVCIQVNVITDVSFIYGFKDRPHFVQPSLPANAQLECVQGEQCHVLYHVTSGEGKEAEGVSVTVKESGYFDELHLYSSCATPLTSGSNCSVDVSLIPGASDVGQEKQLCLRTSLTSSNIEGEERCFKVTTLASPGQKGCQLLNCKNGGFCDGHQADNPLCYCPLSYSGKTCDQPMSTKTTTFLGDLSIPSDVHCVIGEKCTIPFETLIIPDDITELSFTYVDPHVSSYTLTCDITEYSNTTYMGVTTFSTTQVGSYKACIQSNDTCTAETDEFCVLIHAVNGSSTEQAVDMTKPHFLSPTLPGDSTVLCSTNKTCHLDLHFTSGDNFDNPHKCPTVMDTSTIKDGRKHIFSPRYGDTACVSDIVYIPPDTPVTSLVCVQLVLPGKKGENRCFTIKVVADVPQEKLSPCTGGICNRIGTCQDGQVSNPMRENCKCRMKGEPGPSKEGGGGVPVAMIAGVGGGLVVCSGTIAAFVIFKLKKPKIEPVNDGDVSMKTMEGHQQNVQTPKT